MKMKHLCVSYLIPLIKAFEKSKGDVLELGTGFYSTPILDWLCSLYDRKLVSYETGYSWWRRVEKYESPYHEIHYAPDLDKVDLTDRHWGLVLCDHKPAERRLIEAFKLKNHADYIVLHDSEPELDDHYQYSKLYPEFKYVYHYKKVVPHTTIVSNFKRLDNLK